MSLRRKLMVMYLITGILVLITMGAWTYTEFRQKQMIIIQSNLNNQLELLDFSLANFFSHVESNVQALAQNDLIRDSQYEDFTNFLNADESTFKYNIGEQEQSIINLLNTYRLTHPFVNSVYVGYENGSFVRSHPRNAPTQYDPRESPWYTLAVENPDQVMMTEPYSSVTASDINIGVVTALRNPSEKIYGVLGADITLNNLTEYISGFDVGYSGQLLLVDDSGIILASKNSKILFEDIHTILAGQADTLLQENKGVFTFQDDYYFFYTSPTLKWKLAAVVPLSVINQEVQRSAFYPPLLGLLATILLFGLISQIGLNIFISKPLNKLIKITEYNTAADNGYMQVEFNSQDEIGKLGTAYNQMIEVRQQNEKALQQERDLAKALGDAVAILVTSLDVEIVLDFILEQVSLVIPNDSVNIMLLSGDQAYIARSRGYEKYGLENQLAATIFKPSDIPTFKFMMKKKEPILIPDTQKYRGWKKSIGSDLIHSYAAAPIIVDEQVIGFLNMDSRQPKFFNKTHLDTLKTFADYAAIAIDNAQMHQQIRQHAKELQGKIVHATQEIRQRAGELEALYKIGKEITSTLELDALLQTITNEAAEIVKAERAILTLVDPAKNQLENVVGCGFSPAELEEQTISEYRDSICGWVMKEKTPVLSRDIQKDKRQRGKALSLCKKRNYRSVAVAPLEIEGMTTGTLAVIDSQHKRSFNKSDLNLIVLLAGQAAIAIQNARLIVKVQDADRMKSAFLASMSHELRTPLNSIIGFTGILLQGLVGSLNEEQTKQLRMVQGSANHLLELINDILDISKIEAGQLETSSAPFDMRMSVDKIIQALTPMAEKKGLALKAEIAPEIGQINSDQRRVEQILINLVNNAIKFTSQGEVVVRCRIEKNYLLTSIKDTGIGIKQEDITKLFNPFRQIDSGLSRQYEGTGLGLSICKRLVEKLGGKIWVESVWEKGSTFSFTLPIE